MLTACPVPEKAKSRDLVAAFIRGAPRSARGWVFYGVKASNAADLTAALRSPDPVYYIDNAYFDATRGKRFRVTKNRIQVPARELDSDGRRFDALGLAIQPWRCVPDGYWLAVHQSKDHENIAPGHARWLTEAIESLGAHRRVVHRQWHANKIAQVCSLPAFLEDAYGVVTHTSAAAVTAVLAGVPCIVSEQHALARMVCSPDPAIDQRRRFLGVLADHEFTLDELQDGTAWRRLNP